MPLESAYNRGATTYGREERAMDDVMRRVLAQVETNRATLIEDFAACVRIPSVVGHEGPVQEFMRVRYEQLGLEVDVFEADLAAVARHPAYVRTPWGTAGRPNVVGILRGTDPAARSLALNGHVDVVSPEPIEAWSHDPWGGEIVGVGSEQRLYGRGALDMKSGTIANLHALKAVLDAGLQPRGTVLLQSVVEEEAGGGAGTLATLLRGHTADALLTPDPFFGGLSDRAVNLNVGVLRAGDWPSTVAGRAEMECRVAFIPPQTMEEVRREVEDRIASAAQADPWLREHPPAVDWFGWQAEP